MSGHSPPVKERLLYIFAEDIFAEALANHHDAEVVQPQNEYYQETTNNELDPEFLMEVENYLKECMENNEASIDMSDTLI
mgnify:CR=1 FL=1